MRIVLLPVCNRKGHYLAFAHGLADVLEILDAVERHCIIDCVYIVDNYLTIPESLHIPSIWITKEQKQTILERVG